MTLLKLTTVHWEPLHGKGLVRGELFFQTDSFESVEDTPHEEMPGNTHLRSTSGGSWDLEEKDAERVARAIAYADANIPPGLTTIEKVEAVMLKAGISVGGSRSSKRGGKR